MSISAAARGGIFFVGHSGVGRCAERQATAALDVACGGSHPTQWSTPPQVVAVAPRMVADNQLTPYERYRARAA